MAIWIIFLLSIIPMATSEDYTVSGSSIEHIANNLETNTNSIIKQMESIRKSVDKEFVKKAKILEPILDELELEKDLITDMVDHVLSKLHSRDNKYDYTDYEMAQIGNNGGVKQVDLISDVPMEGSRDTQYDLTDVPDEFICPITLDIMNDPVYSVPALFTIHVYDHDIHCL